MENLFTMSAIFHSLVVLYYSLLMIRGLRYTLCSYAETDLIYTLVWSRDLKAAISLSIFPQGVVQLDSVANNIKLSLLLFI